MGQGDEDRRGKEKEGAMKKAGKEEERRKTYTYQCIARRSWGFAKSLRSASCAGLPPDLARQFANRHLCTALADPLLWHTEINMLTTSSLNKYQAYAQGNKQNKKTYEALQICVF